MEKKPKLTFLGQVLRHSLCFSLKIVIETMNPVKESLAPACDFLP